MKYDVTRLVLVGLVSGLRSQMAVAAVALTTEPGESARPASLFAGVWGKRGAAAGAVGELVADKLPWTPSRLNPAGIVSRMAFGGFAAVALSSREPDGAPPVLAAAVGAAASAVGTLAGAYWRRTVAGAGRPDWPAALLEDAAAVLLAYTAVGHTDAARHAVATAAGTASGAVSGAVTGALSPSHGRG
ncbi:hypothetical protein ACIO1C_12675 [Streptomyces sp. NPDC087420]|uniref:hypothetical protein n=1 Tax=Streptomyces sp. NPDC087420 TaxID=3365785 RepID=UPI003836A846